MNVEAILFDLDGTLIDSAPDLAGATNEMRAVRGLPPLSYCALRPVVGSGARGMIGMAFGIGASDSEFAALRDEFFARYESRLLRETQLFDGIGALLDRLDAARVPWAVVTNKIARFTVPIVDALGLRQRAAAVISGDTTAFSKPHPAPLVEAARRMQVPPGACAYVGDDLRDVVAGRAAGMHTAAAAWGYLGRDEPVESWGADRLLKFPAEALELVVRP